MGSRDNGLRPSFPVLTAVVKDSCRTAENRPLKKIEDEMRSATNMFARLWKRCLLEDSTKRSSKDYAVSFSLI